MSALVVAVRSPNHTAKEMRGMTQLEAADGSDGREERRFRTIGLAPLLFGIFGILATCLGVQYAFYTTAMRNMVAGSEEDAQLRRPRVRDDEGRRTAPGRSRSPLHAARGGESGSGDSGGEDGSDSELDPAFSRAGPLPDATTATGDAGALKIAIHITSRVSSAISQT